MEIVYCAFKTTTYFSLPPRTWWRFPIQFKLSSQFSSRGIHKKEKKKNLHFRTCLLARLERNTPKGISNETPERRKGSNRASGEDSSVITHQRSVSTFTPAFVTEYSRRERQPLVYCVVPLTQMNPGRQSVPLRTSSRQYRSLERALEPRSNATVPLCLYFI